VNDVLKRKRLRAWEAGADSFYASEHDRWYYVDDGKYREQAFDVIVDTTGFFPASDLLAPSGRYIMVGQPVPDADILLPNARHLFDGEGKTIKATQGGGFNPDKDIPRYVAMWRSGNLNLDGIITHYFNFEDINTAIETVKNGEAGRVMLRMP
jgi:Zn-dependent alcohol dehydrogenase